MSAPKPQRWHSKSKMTAAQFRAIRHGHGLSQHDFGRVIGISQEHLSRIESGRHPVTITMARLLWFLREEGIPEQWLPVRSERAEALIAQRALAARRAT